MLKFVLFMFEKCAPQRETIGNHFCLLYSIDFRFTYSCNPSCFGLFCYDGDKSKRESSSPPLLSNLPGNVPIKVNH